MKKILMASVFAALPFGAQAADLSNTYSFIQADVEPAPAVIGHLELALGWDRIQASGGGDQHQDYGLFEGFGRVNIPFAGNWNLELETGGSAIFDDGASQSHMGVFAHLWGGGATGRAGVFGGIDFIEDGQLGTAGVEGEIDAGNVTLGAQGSYNQILDCSACSYWGARAWADFYATPNTRLGIEGGYAYFPDSGGSNEGVWDVWGTAEQRFAGTPLSVFVRAGYENDFDEIEFITVSGGIRVFMDGGLDLQTHDQQVPFDVREPQLIQLIDD